MPTLLSPSFTLRELTFSQTGARQNIANNPSAGQVSALRKLCLNILQPLRDSLELPLTVTSGFRSPRLNRAVGGSLSSQHMEGKAADVVCFSLPVKKVFRRVLELELPFDQLIYEGGRTSVWVHVSFVEAGRRGQVLAASFPESGGVKYERLTRQQAMEL